MPVKNKSTEIKVVEIFPQIFEVPPRNDKFAERTYLSDIKDALKVRDVCPICPALIGMKGIGKSQLAKAYAYMSADKRKYDLIWWFNASVSLEPQYKELCERWNKHLSFWNEGIPEGGVKFSPILLEDPQRLIKDIQNSLRLVTRNWLLIYDDISDCEMLNSYRPQIHQSIYKKHILVTSKNSLGWSYPITIKVFNPEESASLLEKMTHRNDREGALSLAKELKHFPLAIAQAAAYISQRTSLTYESYRIIYVNYRDELWKREEKAKAKNPSLLGYDKYEFTVKAAFDLVFREIEEHHFFALELLSICAFLHHENIPLILLKKWTTNQGRDIVFDLDDALSVLSKFSVLQVEKIAPSTQDKNHQDIYSYSIHELLQIILCDKLSLKMTEERLTKLVPIFTEHFQFIKRDPSTWFLSKDLAPHAKVLIKHAEKYPHLFSEEIRSMKINIQINQIDKNIEIEKEKPENRVVHDLNEAELNQKIESIKQKISTIYNNQKELSVTYYDLALHYYFLHRQTKIKTDLIAGKDFLDKVNFLSLDNPTERAYFFNIKGMIHQGLSEYNNNQEENSTLALQNYKSSLRITEEQFNSLSEADKDTSEIQELRHEIARLKNNIGQIYVYLKGDPKRGRKFITEAINIEKSMYGYLKSRNFLWNLYDAYLGYQLKLMYDQIPNDEEIAEYIIYLYLENGVVKYAAKNRRRKIEKGNLDNQTLGDSYLAIQNILRDPSKLKFLDPMNKQLLFIFLEEKGYTPYSEEEAIAFAEILDKIK